MYTLQDVHKQFAESFPVNEIRPFAYLLSKRIQEGHICIAVKDVLNNPEIPYEVTSLPDLNAMKSMVSDFKNANTPFVLHDDNLYFQRYFKYETDILRLVGEKIESGKSSVDQRKEQIEKCRSIINELQADHTLTGLDDAEKVDWQLVAAIRSLLHDFSIITGGPGTGKTKTLSKILRILYAIQPDAKIALAAPTGKASMRMFESLRDSAKEFPSEIVEKINQLQPSTIHVLLGYVKDSIYFKYNSDNRLPHDWIIVDEASMIDVPMFAKLMGALGEQTRIILLGDKDQLASVEAGSLLGDLCQPMKRTNHLSPADAEWINTFIVESERKISQPFISSNNHLLADHITELKLSHRFRALGEIGVLSRLIIGNKQQELEKMIDNTSSPEIAFDQEYSAGLLEAFVQGYEAYLSETNIKEALKKFNQLRVLVTVKEGKGGLYEINKKIETILQQKRKINKDKEFYINRPVIITRNNYELGLLNGDVGIIRPDKEKQPRVWFEDGESPEGVRGILPAYINDCETVFAMTIHKSQGSEFDNVMVVLPDDNENKLLTGELIYTGVTRAKKSVIVQGKKETILTGAAKTVQRGSGIQTRINIKQD